MPKKKDVRKDEAKVEAPEIEKVENELIRYEFSDGQLQKLGGDLSDLLETVTRVEEEASSAAAGFKSDVKAIKLTIYNVARWIREKYDMRKTDCYCYKDFRERKAYYWRADNVELGELEIAISSVDFWKVYPPVKVRDLKHHELQRELPLDTYTPETDQDDDEEVVTE
jgi:hypothetical protein